MGDTVVVHVLNSLEDLTDDVRSVALRVSSALNDLIEQLTARDTKGDNQRIPQGWQQKRIQYSSMTR